MPECTTSRCRSSRCGAASLTAALLLVACAQPQTPPPAVPDLAAINERLNRLEAQVESLERLVTNLPVPPLRSRAQIIANIGALERRRVELLQKYNPAHPEVREIDMRIRLMRLQVEFLDQASQVPQ